MNKKIAALLAIALLISLAGCDGNSGVDDVPSSNSIEASQAPTETPETPTEPSTEPTQEPTTEPSEERTTTPTQEPTTAPTEGQEEQVPTSEESTPEPTQEPTTPPATSTPAPVAPSPSSAPVAQTSTPQTHTHSYTVTTKATCTSEGIETCSCGDTKVISATGQHDYQPQTIAETGHYEQVQNGTKTVVVSTEKYWVIQCKCCHSMFDNSDDFNWHTNPSNPNAPEKCWFSGSNMYQRSKDITEEQPIYEDKWVIDTPEQTIYKCSVCGQGQ